MRVETEGLIILVTGRSFCFSLVWMCSTMFKSDVGYSCLIFFNSTLSPIILLFNAQKMTYSRIKLLPVFFLPYYRVHLIEELFLTDAFYLLNRKCLSVVVHIAVILQSQSVRSFQVLYLTTNCILYAIELMQSCNDSTGLFYLGF